MNAGHLGLLNILLSCGIPVLLLALGLVVGSAVERAHFRRLSVRETGLARIPLSDLRGPPPGVDCGGAVLVMGAVVIGSDHLKSFLARLRNLIGGDVRGFERLMERGRREAICRLVDDAERRKAVAVVNIRIDTSSIGAMRGKKGRPMVEVIASGTALLASGASPQPLDMTLPCPRCGYALTGAGRPGCPECGWGRAG
ncbi:MAG: heavy metal-binding domain-containing protein [Phycisphaerales bacterium]|nr:YbjQ family protein [Phycisphaerae bacterium]NNF44915.1 heavy metal-binding domain-containing protein [Phycisphaerales bacterium]NNM27812.1 heavy metal-binding domain-containing protein [Phycisphaerales bacterium]